MNIDKTQQENELINSEEGDIDRKRKIYFQQECKSINLPFFCFPVLGQQHGEAGVQISWNWSAGWQ